MKTANWFNFVIATLVAIVISACGDDRAVYTEGTGYAGHDNTGTGGNDTGGSDNTGGTTNTGGTGGGSSGTLPGAGMKGVWQVFSYTIYADDAYDTMSYYADKGDELITCATSTSCMTEALNDTQGRPFQFLKEGAYAETFQGLLKGFCVYRTGSCGGSISVEAGYNCQDEDGDTRECLVAGVLQLSEAASGSPDGELPAARVVNIGFESGDECLPAVFCFGAEHGVTFLD